MHGLFYIHNAIRYDLVAFQRVLSKVANSQDTFWFVEFKKWWDLTIGKLHHHHQLEDDLFFPMFVTEFPESKSFFEEKNREHITMDELLNNTSNSIDQLTNKGLSKIETGKLYFNSRNSYAKSLRFRILILFRSTPSGS